jgi:drug/metabolite transporter (DMT)-like permease
VPPVTAVLGYFIFGERLGAAELAGMAAAVLGVYLVIRG